MPAPAPPALAESRRALWLVGAGIVLAWSLHNALLLRREALHLDAAQREPLVLVLRVLVWIVPAVLYLRRHDPRPVGEALGLTSGLDLTRLRTWGFVGLGWLALATLLALGGAREGVEVSGATLLRLLASPHALWLVTGVVLEELLVRGFLLRQMLRHLVAWRAGLASALLFAALHLPAWIAMGGLGPGLAISALVVFLMGAALALLTIVSGSLWPAIVVHALNNLLADWLAGAAG